MKSSSIILASAFSKASNKEVKGLIVKVRPAFVAHLEHAKMMQTSLRK